MQWLVNHKVISIQKINILRAGEGEGGKGNPPSELTLDSPWVTYILPGVKDTRSKIIIVNITKRGFPHTFKYTHSNQIDIP